MGGKVESKESLLDLFATVGAGSTLNTFQRILLMTDGTVTDVLEAYARERVRVVKLAQSFDTASTGEPGHALAGAEKVLLRSILLQGTESGTTFIYADSVMSPERLHPDVLDGLISGEIPVGRLLSQCRLETFREIVGIGFEPAGDIAHHFGVEASSKLVFRTYQIIMHQKPMMRITEKFPVTWFTGP